MRVQSHRKLIFGAVGEEELQAETWVRLKRKKQKQQNQGASTLSGMKGEKQLLSPKGVRRLLGAEVCEHRRNKLGHVGCEPRVWDLKAGN